MKKIFIAVGLVAISMVFWSCENEEETRSTPDERNITEVSEEALAVVQTQLIAVRNAVGQRILEHPEHWDELEEAFLNGDETAVKNLLGFTTAELEGFRMILDQAVANAPLDEELIQDVPGSCSEECIPALFDSMRQNPEAWASLYAPASNRSPDGCRYLPYTAALVSCTTLGPVLYWPCAVVAYCSWCYGPTHDQICGDIPSAL